MLKVENLNQSYGDSRTLWDISIEVPAGQCTCVMGRNGVGKTTLLQCLMGTLPLASGRIEFKGEHIENLKPSSRSRLGIGYVPQGREIFSQMTVEENLRLGLVARQGRAAEVPESVYTLFPVSTNMLKRRGGDLSGGQQQQLAIGRALARQPSLLILDEPEEGIQPNIVQQITAVIEGLTTEGMTILVTSQKLPFVKKVGSRFVMLDKGRVVADNSMDNLDDKLVEKHMRL